MKQRIQEIMDREGMSPGRFADAIGIQRSALSHILNGRNNPSLDVLMKILSRFNYLSTDWLIFGKGEMMKNSAPSLSVEAGADSLISPANDADLSYDAALASTSVSSVAQQAPTVVIKEVERSKIVSRIMIIYSDNTFDNFIPEVAPKSKS